MDKKPTSQPGIRDLIAILVIVAILSVVVFQFFPNQLGEMMRQMPSFFQIPTPPPN